MFTHSIFTWFFPPFITVNKNMELSSYFMCESYFNLLINVNFILTQKCFFCYFSIFLLDFL